MRDFNEADRKKKHARIRIQENPANLSQEALSQLEDTVKASLRDGYLSCPVAWKIAEAANVPKITIGEITDKLGVRVTNCQLGCFKVAKTPHDNSIPQNTADNKIIAMLETLKENNQLTCARVFEIARQFKVKPMDIANEANARNFKIRNCQLGCF
jgi:hypothetical protein